jgi:hypothetical protein
VFTALMAVPCRMTTSKKTATFTSVSPQANCDPTLRLKPGTTTKYQETGCSDTFTHVR